jgi:hypothetical protein
MHSPHKQYKIRIICGEYQVYCPYEINKLAKRQEGYRNFLVEPRHKPVARPA